MNILLWILQGLLAMMFAMSGFMKLSKTKDQIKKTGGDRMDWVDDMKDSNLKLIGLVELMGAIGLILPLLAGILTWLTPFAAIGLGLIMFVAAIFHFTGLSPEDFKDNLNYVPWKLGLIVSHL